MLGRLRARSGQALVPVIDIDRLAVLLPPTGLLELGLVRPITAGAAQTAAAGPAGPGSAADGQADGQHHHHDHGGQDEGEGGGEESVERTGVGQGRVQAPVTAVHRAADEPGPTGPTVLERECQEREERLLVPRQPGL